MGRPPSAVAVSLGAALVGLGLMIGGLVANPSRAWFAYLEAWTFGVTTCAGALLALMIGHAAKASWMVVTQRVTEAIVASMPLFLLLFVPLCFGLRHVYPWAGWTGSAHSALDPALAHAIEHKHAWLNERFFVARTVGYFVVFIAIGGALRAWSRENDARPRIALVLRMRRLSGGMLPVVALVLTWASFDWTMSLEPDWYSTIYGLYVFAGGFVGALGLLAVLLNVWQERDPECPVTGDHRQALGRVLFAMICFWAYMAFSQLLIYWIGDLPEEVTYYALRTTGSWGGVTWLLVVGHFLAPFFLLLNRHWKRNPRYLGAVGGWLFFMHFVDVYWMVLPVHDTGGVRVHYADLGALLFVLGLTCAWTIFRHTQAAPLPRHAPELAEGLTYEASV
jgi:hypothetical protein